MPMMLVRVRSRLVAWRSTSTAFAVGGIFHIDKIHHDDAEISRTPIWRATSCAASILVLRMVCLQIAVGTHAIAGVDVDDRQRLGMVKHEVPAAFEPHLRRSALSILLSNP